MVDSFIVHVFIISVSNIHYSTFDSKIYFSLQELISFYLLQHYIRPWLSGHHTPSVEEDIAALHSDIKVNMAKLHTSIDSLQRSVAAYTTVVHVSPICLLVILIICILFWDINDQLRFKLLL